MRVTNVWFALVPVIFSSMIACAQVKASAQAGTLRITVVDFVEGAPMPSAFVLIHKRVGPGRDITLTLDTAGSGKLALPPGLYDVFVSASAFAPSCATIFVESGQSTNLSLRLKADDAHLEQ